MSAFRCPRTGKAPLPRAEAQRQAAYWNRRWRTPEREAYRCRHCPGWHTARKLAPVGVVPSALVRSASTTPPPITTPSLFDS